MKSRDTASREGWYSIPTPQRKATLPNEVCLCLTFPDIKEAGDFPPNVVLSWWNQNRTGRGL